MTQNFSLKLIDSKAEISKKINKAIAEEVNRLVNKNAPRMKRLLVATIPVWIRETPEIKSLVDSGPHTLNAHFGLGDQAINALDIIVESIVSTIQIRIKPFNDRLVGGVEFAFQPDDFNNLLRLSVGHNKAYQETDLHWLDWLLNKGDSIIVIGYQYKAEQGKGRSEGGTMEKGGVWRVPPEFSGTEKNNFITRSFSGREKQLRMLFEGLFN